MAVSIAIVSSNELPDGTSENLGVAQTPKAIMEFQEFCSAVVVYIIVTMSIRELRNRILEYFSFLFYN